MDEEAINKQKQDICEVFKNAIKLSDLTVSEVFDEYAIFNLTYLVLSIIATVETIAAIEIGEVKP